MFKILLGAFLGTMLFSCSPQKWCEQHYPPDIKDSVWTETEYICETDTVPIPYRAIEWDTTFNFLQDVSFHHVEKKNGLTLTIDLNKGKLSGAASSDSATFYKEYYQKNITQKEIKIVTQMIPCSLEHKTKFNYFCTYFFWIVLIFIVIAFIIWLIKNFFK